MKRIFLLLALVTALAFGLLMSGSASGGGVLPYVVGSGDFTPTGGVPRHFSVNAVNGPKGVSGQITVRLETTPPETIIAEVTCLYAQGNRAVVGSVVTFDSTNPALVGATVKSAFVDNGLAGDPTPDQRSAPVSFGTVGPPTQSDCVSAFPTAFTTLFPIDRGNVTVNAGAAWDPVADFRLSPNQANPSPDSLGNPGVWSYMFSDSLVHDPAHYHLLPHYSVFDCCQQWDSGDATTGFEPLVGVLPDQRLLGLHPQGGQEFGFGHFAILAWRSPVAGRVNINGNVFLGDFACTSVGSGIIWSIDKGSTTLQSSVLPSGGNLDFSLSTTVQMGDTLYFVSDLGLDDLCDSTDLSLLITKP